MIEIGRLPCSGRMALCAFGWESGPGMIGILGRRVIALMTCQALRLSPSVSGSVTIDTCHRHMRAGQREVSDIVIECRRTPRLGCVTSRAFDRKSRSGMIRVGSIDVICRVTGIAR